MMENATSALIAQSAPVGFSPDIFLSIAMIFIMMNMKHMKALMETMKVSSLARKYIKSTGRGVAIMSHINASMFGSMIMMNDAVRLESIIRKAKGRPFDLIVNTFGGDLLASVRMARMLKDNPQIRVVVPKYAWSGGTMISLGASQIVAGKNAVFGPVDPQIGNLIKMFSAKEWQRIVKEKGSKASDDSIAMSVKGKALMDEVWGYVSGLCSGRNLKMRQVKKVLLEGSQSHSSMIGFDQMKEMGFDIIPLESDMADRMVEKMGDLKKIYYKIPRKMK